VAGRPRYVSTVDDQTGIRFVFKTDPADPEMLHIYARHLTNEDDALETFFEGETTRNTRYERFETFTDTHGLYWNWIEHDRVVRVISCFRF